MRRPIYVFREAAPPDEAVEVLVEIWPNVEDERGRVTVALRAAGSGATWDPPLDLFEFQTAEIPEA